MSSKSQALDDLDCMLTQFESGFDKENIAKKETIIEKEIQSNNSPVITNNLTKYKSKNSSLLLLQKKSKSLYSISNCSTPKLSSLEKEIEYLNVLNETGQLNDSVHESPKLVSPIVRCTAALSQNNLASSNESINTPKTNSLGSNLNENCEGLNRKIKFDDDTGSDSGSQKERKIGNKLETVDEDDEILANLNEAEINNSNLLKKSKIEDENSRLANEEKFEISGFRTASGKNLLFNKENVIKDVQNGEVEKLELSGFQTANGKSLLYKKENVLRVEDETKSETKFQLSGFQTANGKSLIYNKENVIKDDTLINADDIGLSGFQTASGKSLHYKKENMLKEENMVNIIKCFINILS